MTRTKPSLAAENSPRLLAAKASPQPPYWLTQRKKAKGNSRKGILYERAAHRHLIKIFGDRYAYSTWFLYTLVDTPTKWCQTDGMYFNFDTGVITLFEMKLQNNERAYHQLFRLYSPVLNFIFPEWKIAPVVMCRWFDKHSLYPQRPHLIADVRDAQPNKFSVHIWRP